MGWEMALTVGMKAASFISSMSAAKQEQRAAEVQARQMEIDAKAAELRGREDALTLAQDAFSVDMANIARAGGYDPYSSMSWLAIQDANEEDAEYAISTALTNSQIDSSRYLANAEDARARGKSARQGALFGGVKSLFSGGLKILELAPGNASTSVMSGYRKTGGTNPY